MIKNLILFLFLISEASFASYTPDIFKRLSGVISPKTSTDKVAAQQFNLLGSTSGYVGLIAPATSGSTVFTLPSADSTGGYVLSTNGSGILSWISPSANDANLALSNLSSVAINTTLVSDTDNTDDLGTTAKAWKEGFINKISLDSNSQTTSIQGSASASASVTYSLPPADGTSGNALLTNGSGVLSWGSPSAVDYSDNANIVATNNAPSANNLTIALKNQAGNDPSAGAPVYVKIRTGNGTFATRTITSALSLVITSGSTLGHGSNTPHKIWVYLIDSDGSGTMKLAVSTTKIAKDFLAITTTAEGGAGGADSNYAVYSDAVYTSKYVQCIGYISTTQNPAGAWGTAVTSYSGKNAIESKDEIIAMYSTNAGATFADSTFTDYICEDLYIDSHNMYNPATGVWTYPSAGIYEVSWTFSFASLTSNTGIYRTRISNSWEMADHYTPILAEASSNSSRAFRTIVYANAGGTDKIQILQSNGASRSLVANGGYNRVRIQKIGELP